MRTWWTVVLAGPLVAGCDSRADASGAASSARESPASASVVEASARRTPAHAPSASSAASTSAKALPAVTPEGYPLDGIETVPDGCKTPWILFARGDKGGLGLHQWPAVEQAFAAHPQFRSVEGAPEPGQIRFWEYDLDPKVSGLGGRQEPEVVLVGECADGATCNRIAGMVEAVVRSGKTAVECSELPRGVVGRGTVRVLQTPAIDDESTRCARIAVCRHLLDRTLTRSQHDDCYHSRFRVDLDCATRQGCEAIVDCAKGR